jgi:hypothetical protein
LSKARSLSWAKPQLTTSSVKEESTTQTAALLSAGPIPHDMTVASRWSKPPQKQKVPPQAVMINYTENNFSEIPMKTRVSKSMANKSENITPNQANNSAQPAPQHIYPLERLCHFSRNKCHSRRRTISIHLSYEVIYRRHEVPKCRRHGNTQEYYGNDATTNRKGQCIASSTGRL